MLAKARLLAIVTVGFAFPAALLAAQTVITAPPNKYSIADDVNLGRQAAQEVEQQLPLLRDDAVASEVENIGRRLVEAIPEQFQHREFRYTFQVINVREINAFSLPGGPMYLNRGMLERAANEGQVAGVMAHEMSHVMLRHGTAQATKATKYEVGSLLGAIVGAVVGGKTGAAISQGTQFGLGTAFLRFSRDFERQADLLGSQVMARAGYDPRDMAEMFRTIEKESGPGGPQWLSDHPNPGDRYNYITKEAQSLRVANPVRMTQDFSQMQARLRQMSPAPTTEQAQRQAGNGNGRRNPAGSSSPTMRSGRLGNVAPPSSRYQSYTEGDLFRVSVPSNWRELADSDSVTFAPEGGYGTVGDQSVFTHGIQFGLSRNESHDLQNATDELIDGLSQANPRMSRPSGYSRVTVAGRQGLRTTLANVSEVTGEEERVVLYSTELRDGSLLYAVGVSPRNMSGNYEPIFNRVVSSLQLLNGR